MTRCNCISKDGNQCARDASTKKEDDNRFCWQHQKCQTMTQQSPKIQQKSPKVPQKSPKIPQKSPITRKKSPKR